MDYGRCLGCKARRLLLVVTALWLWSGVHSLLASSLSNKIEGPDSCLECHKKEGRVWKNTAHFQGFFELHRKTSARDIAKRLNIRRIKTDNRCASCHYTSQMHDGTSKIIAGVSCESCHGPAQDWISLHNEYAEGANRKVESSEQKLQRILRASEQGFRAPHLMYDLASRCYDCHAVADEELVNQGGHPTGNEFELLSWTQGKMRHNFCSSPDQKTNELASRERKRQLYVLGKILDLEYGLRSVGTASEKADYAVSAARRIRDALKQLEKIQQVHSVKEIEQILTLMKNVPLKLNQGDLMLSTAAKVQGLGRSFLLVHDGSQLEALDVLLPAPDQYKGGEPIEHLDYQR